LINDIPKRCSNTKPARKLLDVGHVVLLVGGSSGGTCNQGCHPFCCEHPPTSSVLLWAESELGGRAWLCSKTCTSSLSFCFEANQLKAGRGAEKYIRNVHIENLGALSPNPPGFMGTTWCWGAPWTQSRQVAGAVREVLLFSAPSQRAAPAPAAPGCCLPSGRLQPKGTIGGFILESARLAGNGMAEVTNSSEERGECWQIRFKPDWAKDQNTHGGEPLLQPACGNHW